MEVICRTVTTSITCQSLRRSASSKRTSRESTHARKLCMRTQRCSIHKVSFCATLSTKRPDGTCWKALLKWSTKIRTTWRSSSILSQTGRRRSQMMNSTSILTEMRVWDAVEIASIVGSILFHRFTGRTCLRLWNRIGRTMSCCFVSSVLVKVWDSNIEWKNALLKSMMRLWMRLASSTRWTSISKEWRKYQEHFSQTGRSFQITERTIC